MRRYGRSCVCVLVAVTASFLMPGLAQDQTAISTKKRDIETIAAALTDHEFPTESTRRHVVEFRNMDPVSPFGVFRESGFRLYSFRTSLDYPGAGYRLVAINDTGEVLFPDDVKSFNRIVANAEGAWGNIDRIVETLESYLWASNITGAIELEARIGVSLIQSIDDISFEKNRRGRKERSRVAELHHVAAPRIIKTDGAYKFEFFSWDPYGCVLSKQTLSFRAEAILEYNGQNLEYPIGDCIASSAPRR